MDLDVLRPHQSLCSCEKVHKHNSVSSNSKADSKVGTGPVTAAVIVKPTVTALSR
jgi:hypothetical protein